MGGVGLVDGWGGEELDCQITVQQDLVDEWKGVHSLLRGLVACGCTRIPGTISGGRLGKSPAQWHSASLPHDQGSWYTWPAQTHWSHP